MPRTSSKIRCWAATIRAQMASQSASSADAAAVPACSACEEMAPMVGRAVRRPEDRRGPVALTTVPAEPAEALLRLTEAQERAIDHGEGPLLVLGAAGSGKSEVLARRLVRLSDAGCGPEQVLAIASSRAAARRLRLSV